MAFLPSFFLSHKYCDAGSNILSTQLSAVKSIILLFAKSTIDAFTKSKKAMATYCDAMASIMTGYNYVTTAKSPPAQTITIGKLSFVFRYPAAMESRLKEIFDAK